MPIQRGCQQRGHLRKLRCRLGLDRSEIPGSESKCCLTNDVGGRPALLCVRLSLVNYDDILY